MKERPILMSAPMVLANLAGRKTQTRRMTGLKDIPEGYEFHVIAFSYKVVDGKIVRVSEHSTSPDQDERAIAMFVNGQDYIGIPCPYGTIGDRLWVRERIWNDCNDSWLYGADHQFLPMDYPEGWISKVDHKRSIPSIHMPRWASRIMLEITNIRVEQLKDISKDDAIAEGIYKSGYDDEFKCDIYTYDTEAFSDWSNPIRAYRELIEQINGSDAWKSNPYVWVIEYKIVEIKGGDK